MHLHREVLVRIDELDKQWEMIAKLGIDLLANKRLLILVNQFDQRETLIAARGNDALTTRDVTYLPRFTDIRFINIDILECCYLFATPDGGLQKRLKLKWFHLIKTYFCGRKDTKNFQYTARHYAFLSAFSKK
jgi:hypothetical protein